MLGDRKARLLHLALVVALIGPAILLHLDHLGPGRIPWFRDLSRTHLPFKRFAVGELRAERLPVWTPAHGAGSQLLANPNFFHFHPVSLLFQFLPFARAFSSGLLALSVLGSVGTGLWLRARGANRIAAAFAGNAFALGGLLVSTTNVYNLHASYASVPLALWSAAWLFQKPGPARLALHAFALAMVALGGEPSAFGWALVLGPLLTGRRPRSRQLALHGAAATLALTLAAAQLVPLALLTPETVRGDGFTLAGSSYHSLHPRRLLELVAPLPFGVPLDPNSGAWRGAGTHDGPTPFLLSIHPGILILALAVSGLRKTPDRLLLMAIGLASVILALGRFSPVFSILWSALPPLHWFRYPEKLLLGLFVVIAVLAGHGAEKVLAGRPPVVVALAFTAAFGQLLLAHQQLVPGAASEAFMTPSPLLAELHGHRVYWWLDPTRHVPAATSDALDLHLGYQREAIPPSGVPFGVSYVLDPDPDILDSRRMAAFGREVHASPAARARLLPATAIDRVVAPRELHYGWLQRLAPAALPVYALTEPVAWARVVPWSRIRTVASFVESVNVIADPAFEPRLQTVVEIADANRTTYPTTASTDPEPDQECKVRHSRPTHIELDCPGDSGVAVIAMSYDLGWRAIIDGAPAPLYPSNLAFIAIPLRRAGAPIQLDFVPRGLAIGLRLSLIALVAMTLLVAIDYGMRMRPRNSATPRASAANTR